MPIYQYRCTSCNYQCDMVHGMGEIVKSECPACGAPMRKLFTVPNVAWSSFINPSPAVQRHLDTVSQQRDKFEERHNG